jgi:malonyl-CoA O-methyltransferase
MNVVQEFSRFANQYDTYNIIQKKVAKKLLSMVGNRRRYKAIVDIGCGSGVIYQNIVSSNISFEKFLALDFSEAMLDIHPTGESIEKISFDFNNRDNFQKLSIPENTLIISSSALQWSNNLDMTLESISQLGYEFYFSFFTSQTFCTLHQIANIQSPIFTEEMIKSSLTRYYNIYCESISYQLYFNDIRQMFQYIKRSGVSGGGKQLTYREIKKLMREYPYDYLEFEVLFIKATPKG